MDSQSFIGRTQELLSKYWLPLGLFLLGLIVLGYGLIVLLKASDSPSEIVFETSQSESSSSAKLMVDISGAVMKPGVYEFSFDSRIKDVLEKAGGLSATADKPWVSKNINLASKIQDGAKIYIPTIDEVSNQGSSVLGSSVGNIGTVQASSLLININTASQSELESLPAVGPVTAGKIISNRPYNDLNELVSKKAVGQATFEKIKDKITTN